VPWGRITIGETVWMKWVGGPIVARAVVQGFRQIEDCTAGRLRDAVAGYRLADLEEYWTTRPPTFSSVTVYLEHEEWLDEAIEPSARSRGESWIVLDTKGLEDSWLIEGKPQQRPARKRSSSPSRTISPKLRFEILKRDDFTCKYCGRRAPEVTLHIDHIEPWSKGGRTESSNLCVACQDCNLGKGARRLT